MTGNVKAIFEIILMTLEVKQMRQTFVFTTKSLSSLTQVSRARQSTGYCQQPLSDSVSLTTPRFMILFWNLLWFFTPGLVHCIFEGHQWEPCYFNSAFLQILILPIKLWFLSHFRENLFAKQYWTSLSCLSQLSQDSLSVTGTGGQCTLWSRMRLCKQLAQF